MVVFSRDNARKVEFQIDSEKLEAFVEAIHKATGELEKAAAKAQDVMKQLKEATEASALKANESVRELNKAAEKVRNARPTWKPPAGGRQW